MGYGLSCATVKYFAEAFVKDEISDKLHDEIVDHIIGCEKCFNYIVTIANTLQCPAIIERRFKQSQSTDTEVNKVEKKNAPVSSKGVYNLYNSWTDAAKVCDLSILMQLKAVRDCSMEIFEVPEGESETFRDFGLFIIKKICQRIDHLEKCYNLKDAKAKRK